MDGGLGWRGGMVWKGSGGVTKKKVARGGKGWEGCGRGGVLNT